MAGGRAGGGPAAMGSGGGGAFSGLTGVTAPLSGQGTVGSPLVMPAATASLPGHMSAAHVQAITALQGGQGLGWLARYIGDAVTQTGIPDSSLVYVTAHAGETSNGTGATTYLWEAVTGGGALAAGTLNSQRGGWVKVARITASSTSHSQRVMGAFIEGNAATGRRWYMRQRCKIQGITGLVATTVIAFGASTQSSHAAHFIDVGVIQANSATLWSARINGTTIVNLVSTIPFDATSWFDIRLWCNGTNVFLSVNSETPVSGAYVAFTNPLRPNLAYITDNSSVQRELWTAKAIWAVEEQTS